MRKAVVDKKDEGVPVEVMLGKNFILKELVAIPHNIESAKNKMLEADPNLERTYDNLSRYRKMVTPHCN